MENTKYILGDLAKFHAIPIALKLKKPDIFQEKIKKYLACFHPDAPHVKKTKPFQTIVDILKEKESCIPLIPQMEKSFKYHGVNNKTFREPFASICHKDLWPNNFMVKTENGKILDNKFIDFQTYTYDSPVRDLLFFLFTCVNFEVLKNNLDYFIDYYYKDFVKELEELGCFRAEFTHQMFMDEIYHFGEYELFHITFMLVFVVLGKKSDGPPAEVNTPISLVLPTADKLPYKSKERVWWIIEEFHQRNWLKN